MKPKMKAAFIVISYLTIVGQDPHTGIQTAIDCAVQSVDPVSYTHLTLPTNREV